MALVIIENNGRTHNDIRIGRTGVLRFRDDSVRKFGLHKDMRYLVTYDDRYHLNNLND